MIITYSIRSPRLPQFPLRAPRGGLCPPGGLRGAAVAPAASQAGASPHTLGFPGAFPAAEPRRCRRLVLGAWFTRVLRDAASRCGIRTHGGENWWNLNGWEVSGVGSPAGILPAAGVARGVCRILGVLLVPCWERLVWVVIERKSRAGVYHPAGRWARWTSPYVRARSGPPSPFVPRGIAAAWGRPRPPEPAREKGS